MNAISKSSFPAGNPAMLKAARNLAALVVLVGLLTLQGCSKPREATGVMDTPDHHALRGNDFLDAGNFAAAEKEFQLALSLDKKFSQAHAGMAVVEANRGNGQTSNITARKAAFNKADNHAGEALSNAKTKEDERAAHVAAMRARTITQVPADDWLEDVEDHYKQAVKTDPKEQDPNPAYFMARGYRDAFEFNKAISKYEMVIAMNRGRTQEADKEMDIVQKVVRSRPGTKYGKVVAFLPQISRADLASLFIGELKLANIYSRDPKFDTSFRTPDQADGGGAAKPTDISGHPLQADIEEVIKLGVSGLQPDASGKFYPDKPITRAEFAIMVEDILTKVTGEANLKTKFIGGESPFRDVRSDLPYFNAIQTVVSRNLMEPENKVRGIFNPTGNLSGVDGLLVIRALNNELKSYTR